MTNERRDQSSSANGALDDLPSEVAPGELLEERVVRALRARGLLGSGSGRKAARRTDDRPAAKASTRRFWRPSLGSLAAAAAAAAIFLGGYALGHDRGTKATVELVTAVREADAAERAALVQQTGSLHVTALAALAELGRSDPEAATVGMGREVGLSALHAAAIELARLNPDDSRVARILEILEDGRARDDGRSERTVIWF